jgi:hypothetical protein
MGDARHRGGAAGGFCAAVRPQMHDSARHVGFSGGPPVALQHRNLQPRFQLTTLKFRNNPCFERILPGGMCFSA